MSTARTVGPHVLSSNASRGPAGLTTELVRIPRGKATRPGDGSHILGMHVSRPIDVECAAGATRARGLQRPGDMDFVPAGTPGSWEDAAECRILRVTIDPAFVTRVAGDLGRDAARVELVPRLKFRDPRIETILWAMNADLVATTPSDALYVEHLADALAVRLVEIACGTSSPVDETRSSGLTARQLSSLVDFIDANLDDKLTLLALAAVAGIGVTRLKTAFRVSTGSSVHAYVIRRRVDYARRLFATTTIPASEIALAAGFSHQSHMAAAMRRELGLTPSQIERVARRI